MQCLTNHSFFVNGPVLRHEGRSNEHRQHSSNIITPSTRVSHDISWRGLARQALRERTRFTTPRLPRFFFLRACYAQHGDQFEDAACQALSGCFVLCQIIWDVLLWEAASVAVARCACPRAPPLRPWWHRLAPQSGVLVRTLMCRSRQGHLDRHLLMAPERALSALPSPPPCGSHTVNSHGRRPHRLEQKLATQKGNGAWLSLGQGPLYDSQRNERLRSSSSLWLHGNQQLKQACGEVGGFYHRWSAAAEKCILNSSEPGSKETCRGIGTVMKTKIVPIIRRVAEDEGHAGTGEAMMWAGLVSKIQSTDKLRHTGIGCEHDQTMIRVLRTVCAPRLETLASQAESSRVQQLKSWVWGSLDLPRR